MEITVNEQIQQVFLSCGMGFILGAYYDIFRVIRLMLSCRKWSIFLQDIFFFLTSAVITFLFSLAFMKGNMRLYLFLGEGIGFFAYYFTIGCVVIRFARVVITTLVRLWNRFWHLVFFPIRLAERVLRRPAANLWNIIKKIMKKGLINLKKGLKGIPCLLYNHRKGSQSNSSRLHRRGKRKYEGR